MTDLRRQIDDLIYREAELLDDLALDEWLTLFTHDGIYWIPIDDQVPRTASASLIYDDAISREERVHHLLHLKFPAQNPRSRTVHCVSNVRCLDEHQGVYRVRSSQVVHEARTGDYAQIGLGEVHTYAGIVEHQLRQVDGELKIQLKKILLINRDMPLGNLTFML